MVITGQGCYQLKGQKQSHQPFHYNVIQGLETEAITFVYDLLRLDTFRNKRFFS
jgi:hypothetical protein